MPGSAEAQRQERHRQQRRAATGAPRQQPQQRRQRRQRRKHSSTESTPATCSRTSNLQPHQQQRQRVSAGFSCVFFFWRGLRKTRCWRCRGRCSSRVLAKLLRPPRLRRSSPRSALAEIKPKAGHHSLLRGAPEPAPILRLSHSPADYAANTFVLTLPCGKAVRQARKLREDERCPIMWLGLFQDLVLVFFQDLLDEV